MHFVSKEALSGLDSTGITSDPLATLVQATFDDISDPEADKIPGSGPQVQLMLGQDTPDQHSAHAASPSAPPIDPQTVKVLTASLEAAEKHNEKLENQLSSARAKILMLESQNATGIP
jgi:hypothetical protein